MGRRSEDVEYVGLYIDRVQKEKLAEICRNGDETYSQIIRRLIKKYLEEQEK